MEGLGAIFIQNKIYGIYGLMYQQKFLLSYFNKDNAFFSITFKNQRLLDGSEY